MHLIAPLASGVPSAASGSALLLKRGTSTQVTYWSDFEATQALAVQPVTLDANGGVTVYVNELVDVQVRDANGVLVREFVAGDNATAIEVLSPAFTGTSYSTGQKAAGLPTTLQAVFTSLLASFGATDFNVLVNGAALTMQAAVAGAAGIYFNVKSFGAIGNGTNDDTSFIQAAVTAAAAAGGGTVFLPPGTYRITTQITVPTLVSFLGCGSTSSKLSIDQSGTTPAIDFQGSDAGSRTVSGIWFGAQGQTFNGSCLVKVSGAGARVDFVSCLFGNDAFTACPCIRVESLGISSRVLLDKCSCYITTDNNGVQQTGTGRIVARDSDFTMTRAGAWTNAMFNVIDGVSIDNCRFAALGVTTGNASYISFAPATWGGCVFTNNRFQVFSTSGAAIFNRLGTPQFDCWESGNCFGDLTNGTMLAYGYATDGYAAILQDIGGVRAHGSRDNRIEGVTFNTDIAIDPKSYGTVVIQRTATSAQAISATKGSLGDKFLLQIINNSGGTVTPTFSGTFSFRTGYAAGIGNLTTRNILFEWLPSQSPAIGAWVQIGVETT